MDTAEKAKTQGRGMLEWQRDLLPFMTRTIVILSVFFFIASCAQLIYLQVSILNGPKFDTSSSLSQLSLVQRASQDDILKVAKTRALVLLESSSMEHQYHQANVLLMSRIWTTYIGFVTGMILAVVGTVFILGKIQDPT